MGHSHFNRAGAEVSMDAKRLQRFNELLFVHGGVLASRGGGAGGLNGIRAARRAGRPEEARSAENS